MKQKFETNYRRTCTEIWKEYMNEYIKKYIVDVFAFLWCFGCSALLSLKCWPDCFQSHVCATSMNFPWRWCLNHIGGLTWPSWRLISELLSAVSVDMWLRSDDVLNCDCAKTINDMKKLNCFGEVLRFVKVLKFAWGFYEWVGSLGMTGSSDFWVTRLFLWDNINIFSESKGCFLHSVRV